MIVKGKILDIDYLNNIYKVEVPTFESVSDEKIILTNITVAIPPGVYGGYKKDDVVFVSFEDNNVDKGVIIGKLYVDITTEKNSQCTSNANFSDMNVLNSASLPVNTKIGTTNFVDILNALNANETFRQYNIAEYIRTTIPSSVYQEGNLSRPIKISGGDKSNANKIILDQTNKGQITNTDTDTIFGFMNNTDLTVGSEIYKLKLRSEDGFRPTVNDKPIALAEDIKSTEGNTVVLVDTTQKITGAKQFTGEIGNTQSEAGVYIGLDSNAKGKNANLSIVSANTASYIDMGVPDSDFDFRIIKWNDDNKKSAQLIYGGDKGGVLTVPNKTGTLATDDFQYYTTTEQVVGTWVDGKTIFRKTYQLDISEIAGEANKEWSTSISYEDLNAHQIWQDLTHTFIDGDTAIYSLNSYNTSGGSVDFFNCYINKTDKKICARGKTAGTFKDLYITVEYTKNKETE